jgi:hypothetical protein
VTCERCNGLVDKLFVSGLGRWRWRRMRAHVATCERCRAYYDRVARVWQAMGPGATPPMMEEWLAEELLERVDPARARGRTLRWVTAVAALGAAAALVIALRLGPRDEEWGTRGGHEPVRARGVHAYCIGGRPGEDMMVRSVAAAARPGAAAVELRCRLDDALQFAYSLGPGSEERLVLVGRDAAGQLHWYTAPPEPGPSIPLRAGAEDEPLPASVRLGVRHPAGRLEVEALFARRALGADEVRRALDEGRDPGTLDGVIEHQRLVVVLGR